MLIGLAAIGALVFFLLRKRRRRQGGPGLQELPDSSPPPDPKYDGWEHTGAGVAPAAEADSAQIHEMDIQQGKKMYFDAAKQQWLYEPLPKPQLVRNPTELSADEVPRVGQSRSPAELATQERPGELPAEERRGGSFRFKR